MLPNSNPLLSFLRKRHFLIAIVLSLICIVAEGIFLYYYFYRPLVLTKILVELRQQATIEELNVPLYDKLTAFLKEKQKELPIEWASLRDPFMPAQSTAAPLSSNVALPPPR